MDTQYPPFSEGNDDFPLDRQLEELGKQLGFYVEKSESAAGQASVSGEKRMIKVAAIYHKSDAAQWHRLYRHLMLLEAPGWDVEWSFLRLSPVAEGLFEESLRTQLTQSHLVLLMVSIDLVEALVKQSSKLYETLASFGEETVVMPILLRPVYWSCAFPTIEPTPSRAISLWGSRNQDAAHTTVAKKLSGILQGVKTFLEDANE